MQVKLTVELESGNDAFQDGMFRLETARIMRELTTWLADGAEGHFNLHDINGHRVGVAIFEAWEEETGE
jgi:hypothetical protein